MIKELNELGLSDEFIFEINEMFGPYIKSYTFNTANTRDKDNIEINAILDTLEGKIRENKKRSSKSIELRDQTRNFRLANDSIRYQMLTASHGFVTVLQTKGDYPNINYYNEKTVEYVMKQHGFTGKDLDVYVGGSFFNPHEVLPDRELTFGNTNPEKFETSFLFDNTKFEEIISGRQR